jgi:hypothetical protein
MKKCVKIHFYEGILGEGSVRGKKEAFWISHRLDIHSYCTSRFRMGASRKGRFSLRLCGFARKKMPRPFV